MQERTMRDDERWKCVSAENLSMTSRSRRRATCAAWMRFHAPRALSAASDSTPLSSRRRKRRLLRDCTFRKARPRSTTVRSGSASSSISQQVSASSSTASASEVHQMRSTGSRCGMRMGLTS